MRVWSITFFLVCWTVVFAQGTPRSLFLSVRPQAMVLVQKHHLGPDMVEVTMLDPKFPADLLQKQAEKLGQMIGSPPRALQIFDYSLTENDPKGSFKKATYTVDGLISPDGTQVRLGPILKSFAGFREPFAIRGINVFFANVSAGPALLQMYQSKNGSVRLEGQPSDNPRGLEYRAELLSQDSSLIDVPEGGPAPVKAERPALPPPPKDNDTLLWVFVGLAALSVGALVYSLLLRLRPRARG